MRVRVCLFVTAKNVEAASAVTGAVSAAVEKWYTAAGWVGNKVGPRPRTLRPPPPPASVLATLLATLHEVRCLICSSLL